MSKVWLVLVAIWKILVWWARRDAETQAKRKELSKAVADAIKNKNTRDLHRVMSNL